MYPLLRSFLLDLCIWHLVLPSDFSQAIYVQSSILSSPHMHIKGSVVSKPCRRASVMFDFISNTVSRSLYITLFH